MEDVRCIEQQIHELGMKRNSIPIVRYASLLRACGNTKSWTLGKRLHAHILSKKIIDTFIGNLLVQMYGKCGMLEDALAVFHDDILLRQKNIFSWNILISAYAQNGHYKDGLQLFWRMNLEGMKPDQVTLVSIIDLCARCSTITEAKAVHALVNCSPFHAEVVVGNVLINMYNKFRQLILAKDLFNKMQLRNVITWTAMIVAYVQHGCSADAILLFRYMDLEGIEPNGVTFIGITGAFSGKELLPTAKIIHERAAACGFDTDTVLSNALLVMYGKCGSIHDAWLVYRNIEWKNLALWNSMITAYAQNGNGYAYHALHLYKKMLLEGVQPDIITFVSVIAASSDAECLSEALAVHKQLHERGFDNSCCIILGNSLIKMYSKCGCLMKARKIFDDMVRKDATSWITIISAYSQSSKVCKKEASMLFQLMDLEGFKPDAVAFNSILQASVSLKQGQVIHERINSFGFERNNSLLMVEVIKMYGNYECIEESWKAFELVSHREDVRLWNTMIEIFVECGESLSAFKLYQKMKLQGVRPDAETFTVLLSACCNRGAILEGKALHAEIASLGLKLGNPLLNMYSKCGCVGDAKGVFDDMQNLTTSSWNSTIGAYAEHGDSNEAFEAFDQMKLEGFDPDEVTLLNVLHACSHAGQLHRGHKYFVSLCNDHAVELFVEHYRCIVDLLARAGHLEEAEELIENMPYEPGSIAWKTLLGACRIHNDELRGVHAAEQAFTVRLTPIQRLC